MSKRHLFYLFHPIERSVLKIDEQELLKRLEEIEKMRGMKGVQT